MDHDRFNRVETCHPREVLCLKMSRGGGVTILFLIARGGGGGRGGPKCDPMQGQTGNGQSSLPPSYFEHQQRLMQCSCLQLRGVEGGVGGGGGGGASQCFGAGMLVRKFQLNPKEVQIWAWLRSISNLKTYHPKVYFETTTKNPVGDCFV